MTCPNHGHSFQDESSCCPKCSGQNTQLTRRKNVRELFSSRLFCGQCIAAGIAAVLQMIGGGFPLLLILFMIGGWIVYAQARAAQKSMRGGLRFQLVLLRIVQILCFVLSGVLILSGVVFFVISVTAGKGLLVYLTGACMEYGADISLLAALGNLLDAVASLSPLAAGAAAGGMVVAVGVLFLFIAIVFRPLVQYAAMLAKSEKEKEAPLLPAKACISLIVLGALLILFYILCCVVGEPRLCFRSHYISACILVSFLWLFPIAEVKPRTP